MYLFTRSQAFLTLNHVLAFAAVSFPYLGSYFPPTTFDRETIDRIVGVTANRSYTVTVPTPRCYSPRPHY